MGKADSISCHYYQRMTLRLYLAFGPAPLERLNCLRGYRGPSYVQLPQILHTVNVLECSVGDPFAVVYIQIRKPL